MKQQKAWLFAVAVMTLLAACGGSETEPVVVVQTEVVAVPVTATPTQNPRVGGTQVRPADGMVMVYVPAGTFPMGSEDGAYTESPIHEVTLDAFWLDQTEVTNSKFGQFVADTGYGRLPTEAEWEFAARGLEGLVYPWDDEFDGTHLNFRDRQCTLEPLMMADRPVNDGHALTAPAGSYPAGLSWVGANDLAGSVMEWVADWYDSDYHPSAPSANPSGPTTGEFKVLRGSGWWDPAVYTRSAYRVYTPPDERNGGIGFRCVVPEG